MEPGDRELLIQFVEQIHEDLPFVFEVSGEFLAPSVAETLWPAWEALQARDEFGQLRGALESGEFDHELDRAGLHGPELQFKLAGVDNARNEAREIRSPRMLRRWLKWIDVILGSLLSAVGIGEGIKELKEGVESELERAE